MASCARVMNEARARAHLAGRDTKGLVKEAPGALLMLAAGLLAA